MNADLENDYNHIRSGGVAFYEQKRGLIAVWGKEAIQFLDGMITNDMKTLEDGTQMLAAFPNAQGRLVAVIRVLRQGDRFFIETEDATREKVFQNLFRFTFAGDFFVEDLSDNADDILGIAQELSETQRIEAGIPKYGVDMDETTIVPELGLDGLISYNKGCYIGQEIIARIHFRGHVAKRLTGIMQWEPGASATGLLPGGELVSFDGKNAGRITSVAYSPTLDKTIALALVRYDYLTAGTELMAGDVKAVVTDLPFVS